MKALLALLIALAVSITACESIFKPTAAERVPVFRLVQSDVDALLAYFEATRHQSKEAQRRELSALQRRLNATPSGVARLQLALLLSAPHTEFRDTAQALKLLEATLKDSGEVDAGIKNLALMLQSHLTLAAQQDENIRNLTQRVKDEQRRTDQLNQVNQAKQNDVSQQEQKRKEDQKRADNAQAKQEENIQLLQQKLREEQKRAEELQQKLDALMRIEKNLIERQQSKEVK